MYTCYDQEIMADDTGTPKKGFPSSFFFLLISVVLLVLMVQNFMESKSADVAFNYEAEHLVNLDLVEPQDSKKIALNDNLVTFYGKFRPQETETGKARFRYLELLQQHHQLDDSIEQTQSALSDLHATITSAATYYLRISGLALPKEGFVVIPAAFDMPGQVNNVIITDVEATQPNLKNVAFEVKQLSASTATKEQLHESAENLSELVHAYRSPLLGIGNEVMKEKLKSLAQLLTDAATKSATDQIALYNQVVVDLQALSAQLAEDNGSIRLTQVRSVRAWREQTAELGDILTKLETNDQQLDAARAQVADVIWYFNNEQLSTKALERQSSEAYTKWYVDAKQEWDNFAVNKGLPFKAPDQPLNLALQKSFKSEEPAPNYLSYLLTFLPVLMIVFLLYFVFSRQMKGVGGAAMNFGKSPAKLLVKGQSTITFKDVAGIDEAKEELQEIVDFLKNPGKFTALGARIPKGVLCIGAPGTGKTLLAKAVAGEADRPFFSISGSDFVEMFVGVGASRIRDLFGEAKKNAPCLVFIDEIDAVGRHRGAGIGGGHDEREQTLNQLLVEMDGFDTNEGVILMAATNRPDVLDKALLRPGRFDRRIVLDMPDIKGRFEILQVHAKKIKIDPNADLMAIARATPGASGADLANVLNEAALSAARKGKTMVSDDELMEASDKVRYGKQRKSLEIDANEKKTTAYHETGHAVVGLVVKRADPVDKVTIIPRGLSLGATHFLPTKNRLSYWKQEILDQLAVMMGGRAAEEIFVGDMSSGAQMDIEQATAMARSMVCKWGMTDELGLVAYERTTEAGQYLGMSQSEKSFSEKSAETIDQQVRKFIDEAYKRARQILEEKRSQVELMTAMLLEFETLDRDDVEKIMAGQWDPEAKRAKVKALIDKAKIPPSLPTVEETPPAPAAT